MTVAAGPFFERILTVNLFMIAFNMIPAFPMDGGRVLRAVLAMRSGHRRATQIAASFGQGIAVFFGVIGLFYNPFLLFIALFVWFGASQEARAAQLQSAVDGIPVQQAMLTDFKTLDKNDSLDRAVELTLAGSQKDFPVVDNGLIEGILTQADLINALTARDQYPTVSSAIQHKVEAVESFDMLEAAFDKLKNCNCRTLPVTLNSRLVGLLTMDKLSEYLRIRAALAN
jgi:CBS domain-containing protein